MAMRKNSSSMIHCWVPDQDDDSNKSNQGREKDVINKGVLYVSKDANWWFHFDGIIWHNDMLDSNIFNGVSWLSFAHFLQL